MISQRLLNKFPSWSKARQDPSSFSARLFSIWGDYFDFAHAENKRVLDDAKLLRRGLGHGYISYVTLSDDDQMASTLLPSGELSWTYPTVTGTVGVTNYTVSRVNSIEELFWSPVTRISTATQYGVENLLVYSDNRTGTVVNNTIDYPAHLVVVVGASTNFYKKSTFSNIKASGIHAVIIEGYDVNGTAVKEFVYVSDDDIYMTRNIFTEITEVHLEGFDGPVSIYIGQAQSYIIDPFHICVTEEIEGPQKLKVETQTVSATPYARLLYFTNLIKRGIDYKDGSPEISDNDEERWEQYLLDDQGTPYQPVDIAINPNDTRLYCLDTTGKVHIYEHKESPFSPPALQSALTKSSYIELLPIKSWARLDESLTIFTRFTRIRYPIVSVTIKRRSPAGTVNYLQADKTWSGSVHAFSAVGISEDILPEDSWVDFSFTNTFTALGQWEFYCETVTAYDTTVNYVGVMVDSLEAVKTLTTAVTNPIALWFGPDDRLIVTSTNNGPGAEANSFYAFTQYSDMYLPDLDNQILFLREQYDSVGVT